MPYWFKGLCIVIEQLKSSSVHIPFFWIEEHYTETIISKLVIKESYRLL